MAMTIRSRKVRRILRLEGHADRQATREVRATARALTLRRRVDTLRGEARALEASLNGAQRAELARAHEDAGAPLPVEPLSRRRRRAVDGPHERAAHDPMTGSLDFIGPALSREV